MNKELIERVLSRLKEIREQKETNKEWGICDNVRFYIGQTDIHDMLESSFSVLGYHSRFPVEHYLFTKSNIFVRAYLRLRYKNYVKYFTASGETKFDKNTRHGKVRLKLLDELIEMFTDDLKTSY